MPNAPKSYEMNQNVSLGSSGVDRVRLLRKIPTRLRGTNFCTSSACFAWSFVREPNGPKFLARTFQLGSNGSGSVRSLRKIPARLCGTNFCTSSARFAPSFVRQPNGPGCTQMVRNAQKHQFSVQYSGSGVFVVKIRTQLRGTNICTSSAHFAPSFVRQPNGSECTQMV